jgi:hypothetical protein
LNKEIKRTAKKTKFQTSTCAQHETPKLKCKTYGKLKIRKKLMKKLRNHGPGHRLIPRTSAGLSGHAPWERGF